MLVEEKKTSSTPHYRRAICLAVGSLALNTNALLLCRGSVEFHSSRQSYIVRFLYRALKCVSAVLEWVG